MLNQRTVLSIRGYMSINYQTSSDYSVFLIDGKTSLIQPKWRKAIFIHENLEFFERNSQKNNFILNCLQQLELS